MQNVKANLLKTFDRMITQHWLIFQPAANLFAHIGIVYLLHQNKMFSI